MMGNNCSKLSHKLLDLGFFSALGTSEGVGFNRLAQFIGRGKPNTFDRNNGVTAVYDEEGRPWIIRTRNIPDKTQDDFLDIQGVFRDYDLKRGAYVPHSNDGGTFVNEILQKL